MSLNWNLTALRPDDLKHAKSEDAWPMTEAVILSMMGIGMREITEKNFPEVCARFAIYQQLTGLLRRVNDRDEELLPHHLVRYIGLSTNVSTITRAKFLKNLTTHVERQAFRAAKDLLAARGATASEPPATAHIKMRFARQE